MLFSEYVAAVQAVTKWSKHMLSPQHHRAAEKVYDMDELDAVIDAAEKAGRVWGKDGYNEGFAIRHGATIEFIEKTPRGKQLFYEALEAVRKQDELDDAWFQMRLLIPKLERHGYTVIVKEALDDKCGCQACKPCDCEMCQPAAERSN